MPNKDFKTWKTFSWKCSFYVSAWQTRLLQVSRTTVSTGKWVNTFFFFSIVFSPFFLLENNSKQTNCEKAEDPSVQPFSVFTCFVLFFLAHVGSSLPPLLLAWEMSKGRMFTKTSLEGNETFGFTVLDRTRRSTGREGRVKGSKVTVFNSEGFHATAVTNNTHDSRTPCLQLIITILLSLFSFLTFLTFDRLYVTFMQMKKQTKKAKHGRSTGQMICCCGDINNTSGKSPTSDFSVFPMT